jgi:hypothetical protein
MERLQKRMAFSEQGFIFGMVGVRVKVGVDVACHCERSAPQCSVARSFRVDEMIVIVTQRNWRLSSTATLRVEDG